MPYVQTPNLRIHYRVAGDGDITLVLLHGNFGSWRWWEPVLERLPSGYRAYAPDLRGCGDSARPGFGHNIEVLTSDVFDFITSLSLCDVHLVGHSLGGAVALQAARDHPDLVRSLLLIAPPPAEGRSVVRNGDSFSHWVSRLFDTNREAAVVTLGATYRLLRHLGAHRPLLRRALMRLAPTLVYDDAFITLVSDAARMAPQAVIGHLQTLECDRAEVVQQDGLSLLSGTPPRQFDLVFLDPPFHQDLLEPACSALEANGWLADDAQIYIESEQSPSQLTLPGSWQLHREKRAGQVWYSLWHRQA